MKTDFKNNRPKGFNNKEDRFFNPINKRDGETYYRNSKFIFT